jgi:hypothetical protein
MVTLDNPGSRTSTYEKDHQEPLKWILFIYIGMSVLRLLDSSLPEVESNQSLTPRRLEASSTAFVGIRFLPLVLPYINFGRYPRGKWP